MLPALRVFGLVCAVVLPLAPVAAPALIELAGHGVLRARVFPIGPGETRKITLRYTQMLDRVGDAWRFRYTAGTGAGAASSASFRMQVDSAARFGDPYSPTHQLSTSRSDNRIELTLADTTPRGDLELFLPLARTLVGMSLVTSQPVGEDGFFMLLLAPGRDRKSTRLNSSHLGISYAVFCLKKKKYEMLSRDRLQNHL